jgi:hypothetical protein
MKLALLFLFLTTTASSAQVVVLPPRHHHVYVPPVVVRPGGPIYQYPVSRNCPIGTSWQYGCVAWDAPDPGEIVGECIREAFSCKRIPGQIQ